MPDRALFLSISAETLEEIGIRGDKIFRDTGGGELILVPCLNNQAQWVDALSSLCRSADTQALTASST